MIKITQISLGGIAAPYMTATSKKLHFSWSADTDNAAARQKRFRLIVKSGADVLYDSGKVESDKTEHEFICGKLPSGAQLSVILKAEDESGCTDEINAGFKTACLDAELGEWVEASEKSDGAVYFLKKLHLSNEPLRGAIFYCALGTGKAYFNGKKLSENRLVTPFTNYNKECMYETDIIPQELLRRGENTVRIIAANGWRKNYGEYLSNLSEERKITFMGEICLSALVLIEYKDGSRELFPTDETWLSARGAYEKAHLFDGETYNFNVSDEDSALLARSAPVRISDFSTDYLHAADIEPIVIKRVIKPVMSYLKNGKTIYDFGENAAGVLRFNIDGSSENGGEITVRHAELLDENGELYTLPLRGARQTDTVILPKGSVKTQYTPEFTYHGFRYAEIKAKGFRGNVRPEFCVFYTDIDSGSFFRCSNQLVNEIYKAAVRTERSNLHSVATDCPQRDERMGWMNDATVRFPSMIYNFNAAKLLGKIVRDITNEQDSGGRITCTAPFVYGERPADPVCSSYLIAALLAYDFGNTAALEENFGSLCAWNDYLKTRYKDGQIDYSYYGDWAGPEDSCFSKTTIGDSDTEKTEEYDTGAAYSLYAPGKLVSTLFYFLNCRLLEIAARRLGKAAESFSAEKKRVRTDFLNKFFDCETGKVYNGSQACQALALGVGIIPEEYSAKAAEACAAAVKAAGVRFQTGNLATPMLLDVLTKYGYNELAWQLFTKCDYPSVGYMLANGATTVWERFELKKEYGMNSHNHPMYGSVSAWLFRSLAGIKINGNKVSVTPSVPSELLYFELSVPSVHGSVYLKYEKRYGAERFYAKLPLGMNGCLSYGEKNAMLSQGFNVVEV